MSRRANAQRRKRSARSEAATAIRVAAYVKTLQSLTDEDRAALHGVTVDDYRWLVQRYGPEPWAPIEQAFGQRIEEIAAERRALASLA